MFCICRWLGIVLVYCYNIYKNSTISKYISNLALYDAECVCQTLRLAVITSSPCASSAAQLISCLFTFVLSRGYNAPPKPPVCAKDYTASSALSVQTEATNNYRGSMGVVEMVCGD